MARCVPGSQRRDLMAEKREWAEKLLRKGLTVSQVAAQLRCSRGFVRHVRDEMLVPS